MPLRDPVCAKLHSEIEEAFAHRFSGALTPRFRPQHGKIPLGFAPLDALLQGGFPIGGLSELVGPASSGRTTAAVSLLARAMQKECTAAWVDVDDTFDPCSAAESGVDLQRLLWVRCRKKTNSRTTQTAPPAVLHAHVRPEQQIPKGGGSPHPRSEDRGMQDAIAAMLSKYPSASAVPDKRARRAIGTPGAPNRPVMPFPASSPYREEQAGTDRVASRRENVFQRTEELMQQKSLGLPQSRPTRLEVSAEALSLPQKKRALAEVKTLRKERWGALEKALQATDLLVHAGGFTLLVLDLGNVAPEMALRVPLSTWFRFRSACERMRTTLVMLTQQPCAKTSADMLVRFESASLLVNGLVVTEMAYKATVERMRPNYANLQNPLLSKRQPRSESSCEWRAETTWAMRR